jgi:TPR repeat protein
VFCEKGIGVTKDDQAAFRYIEAAAKNGYPPAINKLGDFYFSGYGCKRDPETAFMFYEKAASEGYLQSFVNMGILYEEGYVPSGPSMDKAIECYQQAASGGNPNGYMNLGLLTWNRNLKEDAEAFLKKAA